MKAVSSGRSTEVRGAQDGAAAWISDVELTADDGSWDDEEITLVFLGPSSRSPESGEAAPSAEPAADPRPSGIGTVMFVAALTVVMTVAVAFA